MKEEAQIFAGAPVSDISLLLLTLSFILQSTCKLGGVGIGALLRAHEKKKIKPNSQFSQFTPFNVSSGVDRWRRPLLDRTRPFAVIDRQKRSLMEALQVRHLMMMSCSADVYFHITDPCDTSNNLS